MISGPGTFAIIATVAVLTGRTVSSPVRYDQRQEGDLNVRTDVEDVVFVVVPPKDLISAGMHVGLAATAANLLSKKYGGLGPEAWLQRTSSKLGFRPMEKSPYKIDLERSDVPVKKIAQPGDPIGHNVQKSDIYTGKLPVKVVLDIRETPSKVPVQQTTDNPVVVSEDSIHYTINPGELPVRLELDIWETPSKAPVQDSTENAGLVTKAANEMMPTKEGETVKKDLKSGVEKEEEKMKEVMKEDMKMENTEAKLEKDSKPDMEMKKTETKLEEKSKPEMDMKGSESKLQKISKPGTEMKKSDLVSEKKPKPEMDMKSSESKLEKISKPETEMKKSDPASEKKSKPEMDMKASETKLEKVTNPETEMKKTDLVPERESLTAKKSKPEMNMKTPETKIEKNSKPETGMKKTGLVSEMKKSEGSITPEGLKVIGDFSDEPASIFRLEGCGPDAYRDSTGKCVVRTTEKNISAVVMVCTFLHGKSHTFFFVEGWGDFEGRRQLLSPKRTDETLVQ